MEAKASLRIRGNLMEPKTRHQRRNWSLVKLFSVTSAAEGLSVQGLIAELPNLVFQTTSPLTMEQIYIHIQRHRVGKSRANMENI